VGPPVPPSNPFPRRLLEARQRAGLSQAKLGELAGLDPSVASARINQYERGVHEPKFQMASMLSRALAVPTAFLYCEEDALAARILELAENLQG
jgi:transcriptional regulator with XRE-family HTH domain